MQIIQHTLALSFRIGQREDGDQLMSLYRRVQADLAAKGSAQEIRPFESAWVEPELRLGRCVVAESDSNVVGCVFFTTLAEDYYDRSTGFDIWEFPQPWHNVYSLLLDPTLQGQGLGAQLFRHIVNYLKPARGTIVLDCWAGNEKLKAFYTRAGCTYVATVPEQTWEVAVFVLKLADSV